MRHCFDIVVRGVCSLWTACVVVYASSAYALDCKKASLHVEKLLCATPLLKNADDAMSAAYFKLLHTPKDPDFRDALVRSQRRWLELRAHGTFPRSEGDTNSDTDILLKVTIERLKYLQKWPEAIFESEKKIAFRDGGPLAGYESSCQFTSWRDDWFYGCYGAFHRQKGDRICSIGQDFSYRTTNYQLVSVVRDGVARAVASCSIGYGETSERCPGHDYGDAQLEAEAHWNTNPQPSEWLAPPRAGHLWKYDLDAPQLMVDDAWVGDCLSAANYPPPGISRPD